MIDIKVGQRWRYVHWCHDMIIEVAGIPDSGSGKITCCIIQFFKKDPGCPYYVGKKAEIYSLERYGIYLPGQDAP